MGTSQGISERRLVIFDWDGTLADTRHGILATAQEVLRRMGRGPADEKALAATIGAQVLEIAAKVGETGKLYGSVTTEQLAEALAAKGLQIEKKDITILAPEVKELGEYEAAVKLYKGIKGTFKFNVVAE